MPPIASQSVPFVSEAQKYPRAPAAMGAHSQEIPFNDQHFFFARIAKKSVLPNSIRLRADKLGQVHADDTCEMRLPPGSDL